MKTRFAEEYSITISPGSPKEINIGEVSLEEGEDTIWAKVTSSSSGGCPWPWSYALLTWTTSEGRELGTAKIHGVCDGEIFRLGIGRPPSIRTGMLSVWARSYNLAWIEKGNPWTLKFEFEAGESDGGGGTRAGAVINSFVDDANRGLSLVRVNFP